MAEKPDNVQCSRSMNKAEIARFILPWNLIQCLSTLDANPSMLCNKTFILVTIEKCSLIAVRLDRLIVAAAQMVS